VIGCLAYASYFLSKAGFVALIFPIFLMLLPFPRAQQRFLQMVIYHYFGLLSRHWLPFLQVYRVVEISGLDRAQAARPAILVANHRSLMDAPLLMGLLPRTGALIKARDTRMGANALLARYFDLVSIDRHSRNSMAAMLEKSKRLLDTDKNLLVFPEGTRARSGRLQYFNRAAFALALAARRPVLPVVLHSTLPFMAKLPGSIFPPRRMDYRVRFLEPEMPRDDDDDASLCDRVHARMARELKQLDAGTIWERGTVPAPPGAAAAPSATPVLPERNPPEMADL
jgi:1-acyl-sn-glycerol-3-phosphate acyltransferase